MPASEYLAVERLIANAHRSLTHAVSHASTFSELGLHDDLQMLLIELERLQVDLLRGVPRAKYRGRPQRVSQSQRGH